MKAKTKKLKPCPFCGGKIEQHIGLYGLRFFRCKKCGSLTSFDSDKENLNPQLAVDAWNRRAK